MMRMTTKVRASLLVGAALAAMTGATGAMAQSSGTDTAAEDSSDAKEIIVTGSRIKQDPTKSALPLQVIST